MSALVKFQKQFNRRKQRVSSKIIRFIRNTSDMQQARYRLSVFRSGKHFYCQIVDDKKHLTLASASTLEKDVKQSISKTSDKVAASKVGEIIAKRAIENKIEYVVLDKGGYTYSKGSKLEAFAEAARKFGLKF